MLSECCITCLCVERSYAMRMLHGMSMCSERQCIANVAMRVYV